MDTYCMTFSFRGKTVIIYSFATCRTKVCFLLLRVDGIALPTLPLIGCYLLPFVGLVRIRHED